MDRTAISTGSSRGPAPFVVGERVSPLTSTSLLLGAVAPCEPHGSHPGQEQQRGPDQESAHLGPGAGQVAQAATVILRYGQALAVAAVPLSAVRQGAGGRVRHSAGIYIGLRELVARGQRLARGQGALGVRPAGVGELRAARRARSSPPSGWRPCSRRSPACRARQLVAGATGRSADDLVSPVAPELREPLPHRPHALLAVPRPVLELADHPHGLERPKGAGGVAGEPLMVTSRPSSTFPVGARPGQPSSCRIRTHRASP